MGEWLWWDAGYIKNIGAGFACADIFWR